MKFKVGDRVKVNNCKIHERSCQNLGKIFTIKSTDKNDNKFPYELDGITEFFGDDELELVKEFRRVELKHGDIVTLRNGEKLIYHDEDEEFTDISLAHYNSLSHLYDLNDDMTYDGVTKEDRQNDVIKVERPVEYETIYSREKRKMTVSEICDELGYDVEIVKE